MNTITDAFVSEILGTAILIVLGAGVVATVLLPKSKGFNGGWILINFGWGIGVIFKSAVRVFDWVGHMAPPGVVDTRHTKERTPNKGRA